MIVLVQLSLTLMMTVGKDSSVEEPLHVCDSKASRSALGGCLLGMTTELAL
jgi:hypothetical protein